VRWNKAHEAITGYSAEELAGMHILDWFKDDEASVRNITEGVGRAFREGLATAEAFLQTKDHRKIPFFFTACRLEIDGKTYFTGVGIDITERRKAEDELRAAYERITASEEELRDHLNEVADKEKRIRESEENYRSVIEFSPYGMHFYELLPNGDLIFTGANPAADTILGIEHSQFIGKRIEDAFPGLASTEIPDQYRRVAAEGGVWHTDQTQYDEGVIKGAFAVQAFRIRPGIMVAAFSDITERKKVEETLRESEATYRTMLDGIQDVFYRTDTEGTLMMASPSIARILGYDSLDECLGRNIARDFWMYPEQRDAFLEAMKTEGRVNGYEIILKRRDGTPVTVAASSHFYYNKDGKITGVEGIFHDITALRKADQQVQLLAALTEITPASITVHNADGTFLYANQRTFDLHGYSRDEFMALNLHQLDVPTTEELINERIEQLKNHGEASFDVEHYRKDGSTFPLHVNAKLTRWNDTKAILSVASDITEIKRSEDALRESEERLQLALQGAELGTWNWDIETGAVIFSERWAEMIGYHLDEIEPNVKSWELLVHPDDMSRVQEVLTAHLEGKTAFYECEHRMHHKNGSWIWVLDKGMVIERDQDGRPLFAAGTHLDITTRRLAEDALRESEERYRRVIENIQDGYLQVDATGVITMASPSAARMVGLNSADDLVGTPITPYYYPADARQRMLEQIAHHGHVQDYDAEFIRKDGSHFWVSVNAHFIHDNGGNITGSEAIIHDITDRRSMEYAIREANRKLNLLNNITRHDVANQLTALQGYVQIASTMKNDPIIADYLTRIGRVTETINRQIEFTRTYQELGIHAPVWSRIDDIVAKAGSGIPVRFSGTCRGVEVFGDTMLERVFFNLFDNAIRHGSTVTEITVRCEREPDGMIVIVEDDGVGVPLSDKEKIFVRGYGKHTGLGLFLAKEILAITGITIRETGIPGSGARFEILVPKKSVRFSPG
jgi:PAS domain S-box-containing protein